MNKMIDSKILRDKIELEATKQILGRLAVQAADHLRGKNKVNFVYNKDIGDYVVINNPDKIRVTGNKLRDKIYYHHSGYIGNLKEFSLKDALIKNPEKVFYTAVKGMLPSNRLRKIWLSRLSFKYQNNI